ncbi:MAG: flavodoxin family protein [Paludibacteraceae bacterium]|nr:flavodoxin family protein [Paludibacteraceae bacterium]MBQ6789888.1 flavodoxin family protein [Paludibacteraceae bacterium]
MKKVLILSGSPRAKGNSDMLCDEFMRGAVEAGHEVEKIRVAAKKIGFCSACYYCRDHGGVCAQKDDMTEVLQKMLAADVIVMASPVYFYSVDAQMKALIDRTVARWLEFDGKEFYYIMSSAENTDCVMDTTLACFRGMAECFKHSVERGVIYGKGVYEKGEILQSPVMRQAYEMGKGI